MACKVRGVSDLLTPKFVVFAALFCAVVPLHPLFGGQAVQTSKQTNEQILQLASRARTEPVDIPVGAGDVLHIEVFDVPELSRDVQVSATGDITFPLLPGQIHIAGLTVFQLQNKMAQLLRENGLVSHPQVSVMVVKQNSQPISVVGAVHSQMVYHAVGPTTLLQVLAAAGGISDDAGGDVIITRPAPVAEGQPAASTGSAADPPADSTSSTSAADPPSPEVITVNLQDLLNSGASKDIPVRGGDVVRVPQAGIIYVLGRGIAQPGGYVLAGHGETVTVLRVLALAHGLTSFAKPNSAVILRTNPVTGKRDEIHLQLKKIEKNQIADVPVESNDILYIPDSAEKRALARIGQSAIGIGTGVAVYRVAY